MSDLVCRKSMTRCLTPGMCSPHGGCSPTEQVSSAWLTQLRGEFVAFGNQNKTLKAENVRLETERADLWRGKRDVEADRDTKAAVIAELQAQSQRLQQQVATLQSDPNSWQSGYDEGRRMGTKTMLETRALDARLAGFWNSPKELPPAGVPLVVLRDGVNVGNSQHPGHRSGRWLELTTTLNTMFACDAVSTGQVIGWVRADELQGLAGLLKRDELYRFVSRLAWYVDRAASVYGLDSAGQGWAKERRYPDADDVEAAIGAAMAKDETP